MWFRRDLRLRDNPALLAAVAEARADGDGRVVPLFVVDPTIWGPAGDVRRAYLTKSLEALGTNLADALVIRHGDPRHVVPEVVRAAQATAVHCAADFGPLGRVRDHDVAQALQVPLTRTGSPYAVAPGTVRKSDDTPYRVFTPFYRAWRAHGWRAPAAGPPSDADWWQVLESAGLPAAQIDIALPPAGEAAAWKRWRSFKKNGLAEYPELRNRPDVDGTSVLSHHLKWGEIHPRSLLADSTDETFDKELCWREFYADVLFHNPKSRSSSLDSRYDTTMRWTTGPDADAWFDAWASGSTGYPFVDAGMRQLRQTGWMHNRVRMVVASFLIKDLHIPWQRGASHFMAWLRDGDLASNAHGWQWTAGCGTDASPFYRVFNPITQGLKFDPNGDYVRAYIPELRHIPGKAVHEPWNVLDGYANGYPPQIVDHRIEREIALADHAALRG